MFESGGRIYKAVVKSANSANGEIIINIPNIFGEFGEVPISYIERSAIEGVWTVPTPGSTIFVATNDDQFSEVLWIEQNRATVGYVGTEITSAMVDLEAYVDGEIATVNTTITNLIPSTNPVGTVLQYAGSSAPTGYFLCNGASVSKALYPDLFNVIGYNYTSGSAPAGTFNLPNLKGRVAAGLDTGSAYFDVLGRTGGSATHTLIAPEMPVHTHIQNQHTHTQSEHTHTQNEHTHPVIGNTGEDGSHRHSYSYPGGSVLRSSGNLSTAFPGANTSGDTGYAGTHSHTIFFNSYPITATNQNTTATNQFTTPTNQDAGGGFSHNNLQPYIVLNYIIKY